MELNSIFVHIFPLFKFYMSSDSPFVLSRQIAFFICCQRWDSNSLLSVHKPTILVTENVILIGSVASEKNQLLQLCTARTVFPKLVTVRLYTVMPEVCHWLTYEKQRKTDIRLTDQ